MQANFNPIDSWQKKFSIAKTPTQQTLKNCPNET